MDLSLSFKSSYSSMIFGDLMIFLNKGTEEHFATLQIFIAVSKLIPTFPVSTFDKNCSFIFSFSANFSWVSFNAVLISLINIAIFDSKIDLLYLFYRNNV